jgi:hypothetical protein
VGKAGKPRRSQCLQGTWHGKPYLKSFKIPAGDGLTRDWNGAECAGNPAEPRPATSPYQAVARPQARPEACDTAESVSDRWGIGCWPRDNSLARSVGRGEALKERGTTHPPWAETIKGGCRWATLIWSRSGQVWRCSPSPFYSQEISDLGHKVNWGDWWGSTWQRQEKNETCSNSFGKKKMGEAWQSPVGGGRLRPIHQGPRVRTFLDPFFFEKKDRFLSLNSCKLLFLGAG